jgi:hypothetical protein
MIRQFDTPAPSRQQEERAAFTLLPHCDAARAARNRRLVAQVHRFGPRVEAELLDALARKFGLADAIERLLQEFSRIDPTALALYGGDTFPSPPLTVVKTEAAHA